MTDANAVQVAEPTRAVKRQTEIRKCVEAAFMARDNARMSRKVLDDEPGARQSFENAYWYLNLAKRRKYS